VSGVARHGALAVVIVTGPTAAGKSALALALAERFGGEIVNADSMQVYRYMDIGTAKPTLAERARVPHHLIDLVTPEVQYNAGRYAEDAAVAVADVAGRGRRVLLVGGTGLYIRAFLCGGMSGGPSDPELRRRLEAEWDEGLREGDPARLHRRLAELDPETAGAVHPNDRVRIGRAREIQLLSGRPASALRRGGAVPSSAYRTLHLAVDPGREALARRIDIRCEKMIESGLLQEVRRLRERGYGPELASMRAIGYRHMQPVIEGSQTLADVLEEMKRDTRQFARRQRTWLRSVADAVWVHPDDAAGITALAERFWAAGAAAHSPGVV
jgi:tRNA dimethylallyltransferase